MAKRIFELAKELGVTSKIVLEKCRAEGIEIKNHMSTVKAGLAATIGEWFSEIGDGGSAVETTEHVDLDAAHKEAEKKRKRKKTSEPEAPVAVEPEKSETEPVEEQSPDEAPDDTVVEAVSEPVEAVETPAVEEVVQEAPVETVETVETVEPVEPAEPSTADTAPVAEAPVEPVAEVPEEAPVAEEKAPEPEKVEEPKEPEPPKIMPMGPRVVPKPAVMKGPRVVRVEAPDIIPTHRPRRRPMSRPAAGSGPVTPAAPKRFKVNTPEGGGSDSRRGAGSGRRSPRRRGGEGDAKKGAGTPVRRRKQEIRQQDLQERTARLAAAVGGGMRRHRAAVGGKKGGYSAAGSSIRIGLVDIDEPLTLKNVSAVTGIRSNVLIKKLMETGVLMTVNQIVEFDVIQTIMADFDIELVLKRAKTAEEVLADEIAEREKGELTSRAPVVTFLGHVDHGKTSLLDYIRKAGVASGEAGGITQHIGAYRFDQGDQHVVFLDTPGHEAFTAMRARGANMTDVVVLVVAADDGVMPQTIEAISHAKAAEVPIIVALNKCEIANANVNRAMGQLAEHGLNPREWGGDTEVIQTDALSGTGMDTLVETLSIEAELLELKAEADIPASGYVVESQMRPGLGPVATLLVLDGTLKVGDVVLGGQSYGRVRQITDSNGKPITEAGPATPVEISGLSEVCRAGDKFFVAPTIEQARSAAADREQRARVAALGSGQQATLEGLFNQIQADQVSEVKLIVKADVQGSIEALVGSLEKMATEEVKANILHSAVGGITTSDVTLAEASKASIIGFNVVADSAARQLADQKGVEIRVYRIIYEIIDDVKAYMEKGLAPEISEQTVGRAEIRQTFKVSRIGTIAGCIVLDGMASRTAKVRITRNSVVIEDERTLDSLKRFKDDAKDVRAGMECGLKVAGYDDIKEGDILEFYRRVETARTLG
ncbi:MAG: translation initiation factor IF-2 [Phycisphaerales bacterium]|nr:translation initiation factor IF-2 [Phycisphaerales bacterium]